MKLLDILSESIKKERDMFEGINDEDLNELASKDFDVNKFKSLNSYAKKIKYAKEMMGKPLGTGSSRMVFIIDDTKVLKLAKNQKGLIQNEVEIGWADNYYFDNLLANVIDFDENNLWVIMELAKKVKKSDFKRLWGINFQDMFDYLNYVYNINNGKRSYISDEVKEIMDESEDVAEVVDFMLNGDSLAGDLGNVSSWGLVKRDGVETLVLIDFGITNKIYQSYYK